MKPKPNILVFEYLSLGCIPLAVLGKIFGFDIVYFSTSKIELQQWFKSLKNFLAFKKFTDTVSTYHEKIQPHIKAVEKVEEMYGRNFAQRKILKIAIDQLGEDIEYSYKKVMAEMVRNYYTHQLTLSVLGVHYLDQTILFVPDAFLKIKAWLEKAQEKRDDFLKERNIHVPAVVRLYTAVVSMTRQLKWIVIFLLFPFWVFLQIKGIRKQKKDRKNYQVGFRVYKTDLSFFSEQRSIDFLLDGEKLTKDNTLFCVETPISDEYKEQLKQRDYNVVYLSDLFKVVDADFFRKVVLREFLPIWAALLKAIVTAPYFMLEITLKNLNTFLLWKNFLHHYHMEHYVIYNDFSFEHVVRNSLLSKDGTKTWFYLHSRHHSDLFAPDAVKKEYCHTIYSYLIYDNFVIWSHNIESMMRPNRIKNFFGVGCLWSEHIKEIVAGKDFKSLRGKYKQENNGTIKKTISVFDTTFGPHAVLHGEDMVVFVESILKLLHDFPGVQIIFKEKNERREIERDHPEISSLYDQLKKHDRCFLAGDSAETSEISAISDLSLSICFTSPTVEALGARKRAIYFDPTAKFIGTYYDRFPKLVAHNYEDLKSLVNYWVYEATDDEFNRWIDQYIVGQVDAFADGGAITRMRNELIKTGSKR